MNIIETALSLLGQKVTDKVTGFSGVCASITFDAYGCVQGIVTPKADKGKLGEQYWFDIKRLEVSGKRVMPQPQFGQLKFGEERGPGEKPSMPRMPLPRNL